MFDAALARVQSQQPHFVDAVIADAKLTSRLRGDDEEWGGRLDTLVRVLRLVWVTDGFIGQVLYRAKARLQVLGVPILPLLLHRLAIMTADLYIGETVLMHPGVFIGHGLVVIDGFAEIHPGVRIMPGVTIGLRGDNAVEITDGLAVGDQVVITTAASTSGAGGLGGAGGFGGGGLGGGAVIGGGGRGGRGG